MDPLKNLSYGVVFTAPIPSVSGTTLTLRAGEGAYFSANTNATLFPQGVIPQLSTAEIVRITSISGDILTISRAQESSTARIIEVGWQVLSGITEKFLADLSEVAALNAQLIVGRVILSAPTNIGINTSGQAYFDDNVIGSEQALLVPQTDGYIHAVRPLGATDD